MDNKVKVLIVDDSSDIRELVSLICKRNGWETSFSENGKEALEIVKSDPNITFIFMDINMPIMNGTDAAMRIKEFDSNIPVIALSSEDKEDYTKSLGKDNPFDDFISKNEINEIIKISKNVLSSKE